MRKSKASSPSADMNDTPGCVACLADGGGPRCDNLLACMVEAACINPPGYPICDAGLTSLSEAYAECLGTKCCGQFNRCTTDGSDPETCSACFLTGGPLCDAAITCGYQCSCEKHDECTTGDALLSTCSPCAAAICETDEICCTSQWDQSCVELVATTPACVDAGITC